MDQLSRIYPEGFPPTAQVFQLQTDFVSEGICYLIIDGEQVSVTSIGLEGKVNQLDLDKVYACSDENCELGGEAVTFTGVPVERIVALLTRAPIEQDVVDTGVATDTSVSFSFDPTEPAPTPGGDGAGGDPGVGPGDDAIDLDDDGTELDDEPGAVDDEEPK